MDLNDHERRKPNKPEKCPECGSQLKVLLFMGSFPDGYVCSGCDSVLGLSDKQVLGRVF